MTIGALREGSLYVVGAGAQTPVGRSVLSAAAAVRTGLAAFAEHPFVVDSEGEPMIVARAGWLADAMEVEERTVALAVDAAREAMLPLAAAPPARGGIGLHLALSAENLPDAGERRQIRDRIAEGAGLDTAGSATEPVAEGHAGGLGALEAAASRLRRGEERLSLVGGADSWLDPRRLEAIDLEGRVHSTHRTWGFMPGEGAGFCLLSTGATAAGLGLTPLAELVAVATAREAKLMGTRTVCIGEGLTAAFRGVLDGARPVSHGYCDINGEPYRADEYGLAVCRTSDAFEDASAFTAGAASWGDVGAASAPLAVGLALAAWARGYATGPVSLVWSSSAAGPLRGAALLAQYDGGA